MIELAIFRDVLSLILFGSGLRECTVELLEASREDRHKCLRNLV